MPEYLIDSSTLNIQVLTKKFVCKKEMEFVMARDNELLLTRDEKLYFYTQTKAKGILQNKIIDYAVSRSKDIAEAILSIAPYAVIEETIDDGYTFLRRKNTTFKLSEKEYILKYLDGWEIGSPLLFTDYRVNQSYVMTRNSWFAEELWQIEVEIFP